jgi:hypothetical protein
MSATVDETYRVMETDSGLRNIRIDIFPLYQSYNSILVAHLSSSAFISSFFYLFCYFISKFSISSTSSFLFVRCVHPILYSCGLYKSNYVLIPQRFLGIIVM